MVVRRRHLDDSVTEAQVLGPLRHCSEEHLRSTRVAVLLEEVVLDDPAGMDADPIGQGALLQRLLEHGEL